MRKEVVVQNATLGEAQSIERGLPAGNYLFEFRLAEPLSQERLDGLQSLLLSKGVSLLQPVEETITSPSTVSVYLSKPASSGIGFAFVALLPLIPVFLVAGLIGLGIFRIEKITTGITTMLIPVAIIAIAATVAVVMWKKKS